jgi:hypothetical protein
MKVIGGAIKGVVQSYAVFSPNVSVEVAEKTKQERVVPFSRNPWRIVQFCRKEDDLLEILCNGFFKTYASTTLKLMPKRGVHFSLKAR